ncbi:hypothetical protein [Cupriavidus basilensis]|uniref:hypothetical protein n=1 Tax=Cupriavidus basilensis TaxID=68895 RepID=UPI0023E835C8|nr:hypothetical protein [Cupriavidus basilensis]MDF3883149.1 hypothetical protein [Cupriavidus basilensis]
MALEKPALHSVWENDQGDKLIVLDVFDPAEDDEMGEDDYLPGYYRVTFVDYDERNEAAPFGEEFDNEQWMALVKSLDLKQSGVEPGDYAI